MFLLGMAAMLIVVLGWEAGTGKDLRGRKTLKPGQRIASS